jgi:hypothetical protein
LLGADFTATSMIGFIALAGIIVRNSILLVEFARAKVAENMSVKSAITLAAQVRLRPIMITALALVIGSMVLLSDPIFQGMAVSLLFGSLVATFLTLVVIPLGCITVRNHFLAAAAQAAPGGDLPPPAGGAPGGGRPPQGGPSPAPGRPPRLARQGETAAAAAPAPVAGRPPRLERRADPAPDSASDPAPTAPSPGRPPRLERKPEPAVASEPAAEMADPAPARPPRLLRKSETDATGETSASAAAEEPASRPPRLLRRSEIAAAAYDLILPDPKAEPEVPTAPAAEENTARPKKPGRRGRPRKNRDNPGDGQ